MLNTGDAFADLRPVSVPDLKVQILNNFWPGELVAFVKNHQDGPSRCGIARLVKRMLLDGETGGVSTWTEERNERNAYDTTKSGFFSFTIAYFSTNVLPHSTFTKCAPASSSWFSLSPPSLPLRGVDDFVTRLSRKKAQMTQGAMPPQQEQ
ncbi:hypothetical protein Hypma_003926 [Hypsizygus marmoreus]|uniref:Uncharacterized protein n=1 Tax=Hypsizygus marmoreus TaxID=39966 RepID=A0A369JA18_HYPMA|nr:hypothetical protein Hypma_003926 [Hypsizygus marmoreus]